MYSRILVFPTFDVLMEVAIEKAFTEKKLGHSGLLLKNVFIRSAAYEGMLDQGLP